MNSDIINIKKEFTSQISTITSLQKLEELEIEYLGRKGHINKLFSKARETSPDAIKTLGKEINELKQIIEKLVNEKKGNLKTHSSINSSIDTTIPGIKAKFGYLHPTTQTIREINTFFRYMGYSVYEGPEIETEEYNFEKLNLPQDHPARDLADTLYIHEPEWLLRTHTSSVEIRAMTQEEMPIRIVVPGKVYRNETSNTTNNSVFYQYEGLVIDKDISMAHLKGTLIAFVRFLYGKNVKTRLRCKYYPQVEPGAGLDVQCTFCEGIGCNVCKYRGWVEVLGSGMVHPNVLSACNLNPDEWSGFAFGMGLDRLVMLKYGIDDVRKLYNGELVFEDAL